MRTASSPALRAPPIDTVATGTPAGICTIESSESMPSRYFSGTGTPITGSVVSDGDHAGQVRRAAGAGDDHLQPAPGRRLRVGRPCRAGCGARTRRGPRSATPNSSSASAAAAITGQSESLIP